MTILERARETLEAAEIGLQMVASHDPHIRRAGLRNVVVFGRAVTNVIQNLRSVVPDFDKRYGPWAERMKNDTVMKHFYQLRTEILKQGRLRPARPSISTIWT